MTPNVNPGIAICGAEPDSPIERASSVKRRDLMRRFIALPHAVELGLMGRTVRLETNNTAVVDLALKFFQRHQQGPIGVPDFLWRIVCESDPRVQSPDVLVSAFSDPGLRYVSLGQRGFLTVDLKEREAVGFVSDVFVDVAHQSRNSRMLDILFCTTAPGLGLTPMSGGCIGAEDLGVLVFGPPNSGKTTACYLAAQFGEFEFHADQGVFLDMRDGGLRVWGDLFPAVFRPQALTFIPELRRTTRPSAHAGLEFHYFDKAPLQEGRAHSISPICSVFLDRTGEGLRCNEMTREEVQSRLRDQLLFHEDEMFRGQIVEALDALASKPAYALQYGSDPKDASQFIARMLR
jgi:hypothetical protein